MELYGASITTAEQAADLSVHYSSKRIDWETPQAFFDDLNAEFDFTIDVAASAENAKCERFYTWQDNGLYQDWAGERVWCNPPYGREIARWISKAASSNAEVVVMLIPARTDTAAWHNHIFGQAEIRFIRGRLQFGGNGKRRGNAPFPCAVVIFRKTKERI